MKRLHAWGASLLALLLPATAHAQGPDQMLVYIGTFTNGGSEGIYAWRLDAASARAVPLGLVAEARDPGFLALHPGGRFLFAVGAPEAAGPRDTGRVRSFEVDPGSGRLTPLSSVSSGGGGPAYLAVDRTGSSLVVANYGSGSIAAIPIGADGRLAEASDVVQHAGSSVHPTRQTGPHAHSADFSPDNRFVLSADLGLDRLLVYRFDPERGKLTPNDPAFAPLRPGSGPRHFAFGRDGRHVYVSEELTSGVTVFRYDSATAAMAEVQTVSTLPGDFRGDNTVSEVRVHPDGRFLYAANRGHDSIVVFSIDPRTGALEPVQWAPAQGRVPRNFGIDPSGRVLIVANQASNSIAFFRIEPGTGALQPTGQSFEVGSPSYVLFLPVR